MRFTKIPSRWRVARGDAETRITSGATLAIHKQLSSPKPEPNISICRRTETDIPVNVIHHIVKMRFVIWADDFSRKKQKPNNSSLMRGLLSNNLTGWKWYFRNDVARGSSRSSLAMIWIYVRDARTCSTLPRTEADDADLCTELTVIMTHHRRSRPNA